MESKNRSIQLSRIFIENGSNFFPFWRLLKKRSVNDFILASYMLSHPNTIQKCKETHCYVIFHSDSFWKHSDKKLELIKTNIFDIENMSLVRSADMLLICVIWLLTISRQGQASVRLQDGRHETGKTTWDG